MLFVPAGLIFGVPIYVRSGEPFLWKLQASAKKRIDIDLGVGILDGEVTFIWLRRAERK